MSDTATESAQVECLECHRTLKSLASHVRAHGITPAQYKEKHGADTPMGAGWDSYHQKLKEKGITQKEVVHKAKDPGRDALSHLTDSEYETFKSRFSILFKQADMDPALEPSIRDVVLMEINIVRYQNQLMSLTKKPKENAAAIKTFQQLVNTTQEQSLQSLKALNLTREAKQKMKKSPETTPSRLITNYKLTLANMPPLEREKQLEDEADALRRIHDNVEELFALIPSDNQKDEYATEIDDDETLDTERE